MCTPTAMMILTGASTAISAIGAYQQGGFQSDVADNNAIVQTRMAENARARGERAEMKHRLQVAQLKGKQRAAFGASGVDVQRGSASDILADTSMMGELDALSIRNNAELEAYSHEVGATSSSAQADFYKLAGTYNAAGTILGGAGRVSEQWHKYRN